MNTGIIFAYDMFCVIQFTCISNSMLVPCVRHTFLPFPIFLLTFHQNNNLQYKKTIKWKLRTKFLKVFNTQKAVEYMYNRDLPRFFDQVGHQTTNASIGNKHFSLNNDLVRLTKIMNNLVKDLKILSFKVIFQLLNFVESFKKKILCRLFV